MVRRKADIFTLATKHYKGPITVTERELGQNIEMEAAKLRRTFPNMKVHLTGYSDRLVKVPIDDCYNDPYQEDLF